MSRMTESNSKFTMPLENHHRFAKENINPNTLTHQNSQPVFKKMDKAMLDNDPQKKRSTPSSPKTPTDNIRASRLSQGLNTSQAYKYPYLDRSVEGIGHSRVNRVSSSLMKQPN